MSIFITEEISTAFEKYMGEVVDYDFVGNPMIRSAVSDESIVTFAAGYQAAAQKPTNQLGPEDITDDMVKNGITGLTQEPLSKTWHMPSTSSVD